ATDSGMRERPERDAEPLCGGRRPAAVPAGVQSATAREHRQERRPRSGLAALMLGLRLRNEANRPSHIPRAAAEVGVLAIHEKALVEAIELLEQPAADEQARAGEPVRVPGLVVAGG